MTIEVETKDCSMLGDAELEEMAELCAEGPNSFGIGLIGFSFKISFFKLLISLISSKVLLIPREILMDPNAVCSSIPLAKST